MLAFSIALFFLSLISASSATACYSVVLNSYCYQHSSGISTFCYNVTTSGCSVNRVDISSDCTARFSATQSSGSATATGYGWDVSLGPNSQTTVCVNVNGVASKELYPVVDQTNQAGTVAGPYCNVNECQTTPCSNGATCTDFIGYRTCTCLSGFTGSSCETNINDCTGNKCSQGTCVDGINSYTCQCNPGFTGFYCDININECASQPCKYGATCTDQINGVSCACMPGYNGTYCNTIINFCDSNPCVAGSTCNPVFNDYTCTCPPGFTGKNCQYVPSINCATVALSSSCYDHLTDVSSVCLTVTTNSTSSCVATGFTIPTDCGAPISVSPSGASAITVSGKSAYKWSSSMQPGTQTTFCMNYAGQVSIDPADSVVSFAQGDLSLSSFGPRCERNECASSPCKNQSTCIDLPNKYQCICPSGYVGSQCTVRL